MKVSISGMSRCVRGIKHIACLLTHLLLALVTAQPTIAHVTVFFALATTRSNRARTRLHTDTIPLWFALLALASFPAFAESEYWSGFCSAARSAPTPGAACQEAGATLPVCDRPGVTHYNIVSTQNGPASCLVTWQFTEAGGTERRDWSERIGITARQSAPELAGNSCSLPAGVASPHPILLASSEKYRAEIDFEDGGASPLTFTRNYRSSLAQDPSRRRPSALGAAWSHDHGMTLEAIPQAAPINVSVIGANGTKRTFEKVTGGNVWIALNSADRLIQQTTDSWVYHRADDDSTLNFNAAGKLQSAVARNGWATLYTYDSAGRLSSVANAFGRSLNLAYNTSDQLVSVAVPGGRVIVYGYDGASRLSSVTYPDGKKRTFVYENPSFTEALTGILDEDGRRWGTFAFDALGRAVSSELAGSVARYRVSYPESSSSPSSATVIDPLGTSRSYTYGTTLGKLAVTGATLPSGEGEADAASRIQDANGLITSEVDFKGVTSTATWDVARRLPLSITRAADTPQAVTTAYQWHPTFALPTLITEPGRSTAFTHDERGNLLTQTLTDTGTRKEQRWQWTYTPEGLVATQTQPNGATTTYAHDLQGNLTLERNALGDETRYTYDAANRLASATAPSGLLTRYSWDARDRLTTIQRGTGTGSGAGLDTQTTRLAYHPTGTLATLSLPTGLVLSYQHDDAHRTTGWSDNRGNRHAFTLDAIGNRIAERLTDTRGTLVWSTARSVNAINRLASATQGSNQNATFGYDPNGELIAETNGLNQSTRYGLDPLRRIQTVTDAANATAALTHNAQDDITEARDFKGVATRYSRDAQGNASEETSPDIGRIVAEHDLLGLPSRITDAMGQATVIQRNLLGQPVQILYADGKLTTLSYRFGHLVRIVDRSGTTDYTRDPFGRVTLKRIALAGGLVQAVGYSYMPSGQLQTLRQPNGSVLAYRYDATGLLTGIDEDGTPVVAHITWNALGQPLGWTWPFVGPQGLGGTRSYDSAGQLTQTEFASYLHDRAGRISSLTQQLYKPGDADPTHDSIALANTSWSVGYSPQGRITRFATAQNQLGSSVVYTYDANGNRTLSHQVGAGPTTTRNYTIAGNSNRVLGFTQRSGAATTNVSFDYNANGDLTGDGLKRFGYDAEGRLASTTTGATDASPTTRYAHNALGQRVFKTEALYPPAPGDEANPGFMQTLTKFFAQFWQPDASDAERLGTAFMYDEEGSLIAETGTGGASSTGSVRHIYLPTANGPMPIVAVVNGQRFAVSSDHLNTPRRITNDQGPVVWQWAYSAFGETKPTTARNRFADPSIAPNAGTTNIAEFVYNKRYDGMYFDVESGLFANWHRYYDSRTGRYTQGDPIGLAGGLNRNVAVSNNPLRFSDYNGLQAYLPTPLGPMPIALPPAPAGSPASIDPENRYGRGAPPRLQVPWNPATMIPKAIVAGCTALTDWMLSSGENPSLLDSRGERHVLDGDSTGGGHRSGLGRVGKSEFPSDWSDDRIKGEISDIATDPQTHWSKPDTRGYVTGSGTRGGIDIKVVNDIKNGRIVTGYPTNVPRNPR